MATIDTLTTIYRNLLRLDPTRPVPTDHAAQLGVMAQGIDALKAGQAGFGWSYEGAFAWIAGAARETSSVAVLSYAYLTGASVTAAGLDYLVSPTGANPNNLNSPYYARFSLENRYINFAVSIAKEPASNLKFVSDFAPLSLFDTLRKAYGEIFGQAKTDAELQSILTPARAAYFAAYGGDGPEGLGTKAALVGWLLAEAVKADAGPYVQAGRNFLRDLADNDVHQSARFLQSWGAGGDYAPGGAADPGLPGQTAVVAHDWNVAVNKPTEASDIHPLATDGNDIVVSVSGLDAGRTVATGGGNDIVSVTEGAMKGRIDAGAGNDVVVVSQLDGEIVTGAGHDSIGVNGFAPIDITGPNLVPTAVVADFEKGLDTLAFAAALGAGDGTVVASITLLPMASLKEMTQAVAGAVRPGQNGVFEWNGSTYVFHQTGERSLDAGDGLIELVGATGLTVANGAQVGDLHFGAA
jgi:hypothetical protein